MPLTDEQWKELKGMLSHVGRQEEIRERLITIETVVKLSHDSFERYRQDIAAQVAHAQATANKAHTRIDDQEKQVIKIMSVGVGCCGVIVVVGLILKLTGHM